MIIIFHRGYMGFQPVEVTAEISYALDEMNIENWISEGILYMPVSHDNLDPNGLGFKGKVSSPYLVSDKIYYRFLQWDLDTGPEDNIFRKNDKGLRQVSPTFKCSPIGRNHTGSFVLVQDHLDGQYLSALLNADATLEQIDAFCQEYIVGSAKAFIWTPVDEIWELIKKSADEDLDFPYRKIRKGPSKYIFELEAQKIIDDVQAARDKKFVEKKKLIIRKKPPARIKRS